MKIIAIAATDLNGAIGYKNKLLLQSKNDMQNFKRNTLGYTCIFGRKTFESLPKPLSGRKNIVISHDQNYKAKGAKAFQSVTDALQSLPNDATVFICGGAEIYTHTLPLWTDLILTVFDGRANAADAYFPQWATEEWQEESKYEFLDPGTHIGGTIFHYKKNINAPR